MIKCLVKGAAQCCSFFVDVDILVEAVQVRKASIIVIGFLVSYN
jgi:hypothetical protein